MVRRAFAAPIALSGLLVAGGALALPGPAPSAVCVTRADGRLIVDKEKLARAWLSALPINLAAVPPALLTRADASRLAAIVLGQPDLCEDNKACSEADRSSLARIDGRFAVLLAGRFDGYVPTDRPTRTDYFSGPNEEHAVFCPVAEPYRPPTASVAANGVAKPKPDDAAAAGGLAARLRVRASGDQLGIARELASAFQGTQAATVSVARDAVAKSTTYKVNGVVGVMLFDTRPDLSTLGLKVIPYLGVNTTASKPFSGPSKPPSADTVDLGVFAQNFFEGHGARPFSSMLIARPDYLWNRNDGSELASLNLRWIPYLNGEINDYRFFGQDFIAVEPIADLRLDVGDYVRPGTNSPAIAHRNYARLGSQVGVAILSVNKQTPLSFTATYTYLGALSGPLTVRYFSSALTWSLDPKKYTGVTLSYLHGNREDTGKRDDQANVALSFKY